MELTCPITTKLEIYIPDHYVLDTICCITSEWLCDLEFGVESYVVCCEESTLLESVRRSWISLSSGVVGFLQVPRV